MAQRTMFMFPGQGSQYFQMGRELFEEHSAFRRAMLRMDQTLRSLGGRSVIEQLYDDRRTKSDTFDDLVLSHPAIFMVEVAMAETLADLGIQPDAVVGASLGTYAAAVVAGHLGLDAALAVIARQAMVFDAHCSAGVMVAVLGDPGVFASTRLHELSEISAHNYGAHFVLSADARRWDAVERVLDEEELVYAKLPVRFAFHSQWIEGAREPLTPLLRTLKFGTPRIPLYCCAAKDILQDLSAESFWAVAREPIRFWETAQAMERDGPNRYIDVGPSGTLATFLKHGLPAGSTSTTSFVLSPFGRDQDRLAEVVGQTTRVAS